MKRICVCGDREWGSKAAIKREMEKFDPQETTLIHGAAPGADSIAAELAVKLGWVKIEAYPAQWADYGRAAGPIRNKAMVKSGLDLVLAFHPNLAASRGTKNMVKQSEAAGVHVEVFKK
jgi:hypothetical protein